MLELSQWGFIYSAAFVHRLGSLINMGPFGFSPAQPYQMLARQRSGGRGARSSPNRWRKNEPELCSRRRGSAGARQCVDVEPSNGQSRVGEPMISGADFGTNLNVPYDIQGESETKQAKHPSLSCPAEWRT